MTSDGGAAARQAVEARAIEAWKQAHPGRIWAEPTQYAEWIAGYVAAAVAALPALRCARCAQVESEWRHQCIRHFDHEPTDRCHPFVLVSALPEDRTPSALQDVRA